MLGLEELLVALRPVLHHLDLLLLLCALLDALPVLDPLVHDLDRGELTFMGTLVNPNSIGGGGGIDYVMKHLVKSALGRTIRVKKHFVRISIMGTDR